MPEKFEASILWIWRSRRLWIIKLRAAFSKSKSATRYLQDDTIYWVDPQKIVFAMNCEGFYENPPPGKLENGEFTIQEYHGKVLDGDWDKLERKFNEMDIYRSYEERARKGTRWEDLPYYQRVLGQIEKGIKKWDCRNKQDLDARCARLDKIFNDMKQNGYKSRELLKKEQGKDSLFDSDDEIAVNIGRDGDLIFNNGRHRLALAKIAGVKSVPVTITVRHKLWEDFKREIEVNVDKRGRLYAALSHIDLKNIPAHYGDERFEMIKKNMGKGHHTLLDIGADCGFFCHRFEEEGFDCTAVEMEPLTVYFLNKLRRAENKSFKVVPESVLTWSKGKTLKYDVVLALNIFHHFLKERQTFEDLKNLLRSLDTNEMYFEPHLYNEKQMEGAFINYTPEEFVGFVIENSCLKNHKFIGTCEGRQVYKLWR
jgi:hypothetical protein